MLADLLGAEPDANGSSLSSSAQQVGQASTDAGVPGLQPGADQLAASELAVKGRQERKQVQMLVAVKRECLLTPHLEFVVHWRMLHA